MELPVFSPQSAQGGACIGTTVAVKVTIHVLFIGIVLPSFLLRSGGYNVAALRAANRDCSLLAFGKTKDHRPGSLYGKASLVRTAKSRSFGPEKKAASKDKHVGKSVITPSRNKQTSISRTDTKKDWKTRNHSK